MPSFVEDARQSALAAADDLTDTVLVDALAALEADRPIAAVDGVVDRIDDLLHMQDIAGLRRMLEELDPEVYPPEVSTAALMMAMHGPEELRPARDAFRARLETALRGQWSMDPEQIESTMRRLR